MNEDFVTYELAKKLKEKGFNIPFYFYYRTDDKSLRHANVTNPLVYCDKIDDEVVIAPTISQVLKWLREEKGMEVYSNYNRIYKHWTYIARAFDDSCYRGVGGFKSYEQAVLAGIKYVLDKLI